MKLYVSNSCPSCQTVKQSPLFRQRLSQILIRNVDIEPAAMNELYASGSRAVPTLVTDHHTVVGAGDILNYLQNLPL